MEQIFNWVTDKLDYIIQAILLLLPDSPFMMLTQNEAVASLMGYLNWVVPIGEMIAILQAWLVAVGVFYVYQLILRWARAIE